MGFARSRSKLIILFSLLSLGCSKPTKESRCKKIEKKMFALGNGIPSSGEFCLNFMKDTEIACVLKVSAGEDVLACFAQSYRHGMEILCEARNNVSLSGNAAEDSKTVTDMVTRNLRNREAIELFAAIGGANPRMSAAILNDAATKAELPGCAYADYLETLD